MQVTVNYVRPKKITSHTTAAAKFPSNPSGHMLDLL